MGTLGMGGRTEDLYIYGPIGLKELVDTVLRLTGRLDSYAVHIIELDASSLTELDIPIGQKDSLKVVACPMDHRIDTLGYIFKESPYPPKLNVEKLRSLGVDQRFFGALKSGQDVVLPDGRVIQSNKCFQADLQISQICAVLQDTADGSSALPFINNCSLLVHECTYDNSQHEKAIQFGHATPEIAARLAKASNAKRLALTHFSARYESTALLGEEALSTLEGCDCEVILATDFLEVKF